MKKVINEQQLVNIVAEATRRVLKEIGDTAAGRAMLTRAANKAFTMGRPMQGEKFRDASDKAQRDAFGGGKDTIGVDAAGFGYTNVYGDEVNITTNGKVYIRPDGGSTNSIGFLKDVITDNTSRCKVKVGDKMTARKLVAWIQENCAKDGLPEEVLDWHFWAAL